MKKILLIVLTLCVCASPLWAAEEEAAKIKAPVVGVSTNESAITADKIEFDNKEGVILFDQNVLVTDPQFIMRSDRLIVFMAGTNEVDQIMAIGNVSLTNENRSAKCEKAVYTRKDGQIVMSAGEGGLVHLTQGGKNAGTVSGPKMAIWLNEERFEVLGGGKVTLPEGTFKKVDKNLIP